VHEALEDEMVLENDIKLQRKCCFDRAHSWLTFASQPVCSCDVIVLCAIATLSRVYLGPTLVCVR